MIKSKSILNLGLFLCTLSTVNAQTSNEVLQSQYPFLATQHNTIQQSTALIPFFTKLNELKTGERKQVKIVHIGDSHLQADFFSGEIRNLLHSQYGSAGRGFVFPYQIAKTNGPSDYYSVGKGVWESKRAVFVNKPLPIGVGGITLSSTDTNARVLIRFRDSLNEGFDKVTVFREPGLNQYDLAIGIQEPASDSEAFEDLYCLPASDETVALACLFPSVSTQVYIRHIPHGPHQNSGIIYGLSLENTRKSGIIYHTIGVNGAQYSHYYQAQYFTEQITALEPDLIIFSLGTNEAFAHDLGSIDFYNWVDSLVSDLAEKNPESSILICSQPDTYVRRKHANPRNKMIRENLAHYAENRHAAFWDLNTVMGGYGSMGRWFSAGLTAKDKVHFNATGYRLQGKLFYNALTQTHALYRNH